MGRLIIWLGAQIKWILLSNIQLYSILKFSSWHLIQFTMIERRICKMTVFCLTVIAPHEICTICHAWFNFNCVHSSLISCNFGLLCCHYGLHELQIYCQINFANTVQCPTWKSVTGQGIYFYLAFIIFPLFWSYNYMLFPSPTLQSQVSHLSLELQMQSQSEKCSELQNAVEDLPETSAQIMSMQCSVSVLQQMWHFYLVIVDFKHPFVPKSTSM